MGFFINKLRSKGLLAEAEINGQQTEESDTPTQDYTEDQNPDQDQGEQQNQDNTGEEQQQQDDNQDEPTPDYTEDDGGENSDDEQQIDAGEGQQESEVDAIKQQEEELYSNLSPEQLDIKHRELKNQYLAMYDIVVSIIDRIGEVNTTEDNIRTVEYISNTLSSLKDMLTDYVSSIYKTKSYTENSINYNRFLAILNGINKILEEMNSKNSQN